MSSQLQTAAADPTQKASRKLPKFVQIGFGLAILLLNGCSAQPRLPMDTVADLDLTRFMGDWHVLADIATPFDRNAVEPLETYKLAPGGVVETTYSYREGSPDGPLRERNLKGFVSTESPAIWGMQIFWPVKAEYRVVYLDADYQTTIIGRSKRDFVWVMARSPAIDPALFATLMQTVQTLGYDLTKIRIHEPMRSLQVREAESNTQRTDR